MKKSISIIAALALCASATAAFAADKAAGTPDVFVNGTEIFFDDQPAQIVDDFTLVPARGVFEAMGAKVSWDEGKQQVQVESADGNTWVRLIIGDKNMKVYDMSGLFGTLLSGQDFKAPETPVTLEVAPQILNDRTMIPLRAISEAIDADVKWDGGAYAVNITTADAPTAEDYAGMPTLTLSAGADTVAEGETVDVFVNVKNLPADRYVSGITAAVNYDKDNFSYESSSLMSGDAEIPSAVSSDNAEYREGVMKTNFITVDPANAAKSDGKIVKISFKSLNGKEGKFELSNTYSTISGYNISLLLGVGDSLTDTSLLNGKKLNIDTTSVVINAGK